MSYYGFSKSKTERGFRAAFPVLVLLLALAGSVFANSASAGSFQISPTLGEVSAGQSIFTFRVRNAGDLPLTVQVSAKSWSQQNNDDVLADTTDLLVVPPLVTVQPGQSQIIRVAHRARDQSREQSYRLFFTEVPPAPPRGFLGVQTALQISVPVFFAPEQGSHDLQWRTDLSDPDDPRLEVINQGERFARITAIVLSDERERELLRIPGPQYVLGGAIRSWELPQDSEEGPFMKVRVEYASTAEEYSLTLE